MNTSFDYQDVMSKHLEPDTSDYKDLQRWDKWNAWHRLWSKVYIGSNGAIDSTGMVKHYPLLKSQRTRAFREGQF